MPERDSAATGPESWDADRVRALRDWLDDSQTDLAERLGTRQQTVSEWETGASRPRRMSRRLLQIVAEETGFYTVAPREPEAPGPADEPDFGGDDGEAAEERSSG